MKKSLIVLLICLSVLTVFVACSSSPKAKTNGTGIIVTVSYTDLYEKNLNLYCKSYTKDVKPLTLVAENIAIPTSGESITIDLEPGTYTDLQFADKSVEPVHGGTIIAATRKIEYEVKVIEGQYTICNCNLQSIPQ